MGYIYIYIYIYCRYDIIHIPIIPSSWHVFSIAGIYNDIYIYIYYLYICTIWIYMGYIYIYIVDMILYIYLLSHYRDSRYGMDDHKLYTMF